MDKITLKLETRTERGKQNAKLRADGLTPVVAYGHGSEPLALKVSTKELTKIYQQAGGSKIIGIKVGDTTAKNALFHEVDLDPLTGAITHADLLTVRMDEKIKTEVPVRIVGESTAVYQDEGTLMTPLEAIEIEALPGDLPEAIEVDISILDDFEKSIHVSDLVVPAGVEILSEPEELVAKVEPPRSDDDLAALDEEVTEELPEGVEEESAEGEEDEVQAEAETKPEE
ncbi:MAG TPA: 50S ribosomal protein L25 [Candidatus Saccharimonadales bacterium]|nr:50S ribosomal protein L25 [Candidatus Saccharimonadales bacterium]